MESANVGRDIIFNIISIILWNMNIFCVCRGLNDSFFSYEKNTYQLKTFERNGKFYSEILKIKKWKDFLPQYSSKNGFSKKNFTGKDLNYVETFILETCRAEWNHKMCMILVVPALIFNDLSVGAWVSFVIIITNLPFVAIQRFNRFRLLKLKKHILKDTEKPVYMNTAYSINR